LQSQFDLIVDTLKNNEWDKIKAAKSLSVSPRQLSSQIMFLQSNKFNFAEAGLPPKWEVERGLVKLRFGEVVTKHSEDSL